MAAPYPGSFVAGYRTPQEWYDRHKRAKNLVADYGYLALRSNQIADAADLDLKAVAQIARLHAPRYLATLPDLATDAKLVDMVQALFLTGDDAAVSWPNRAAMLADLNALGTACQALVAAETAAALPVGISVNRIREDGAMVDEPVKQAQRPAGLIAAVQGVRDVFDPPPAPKA